MLNQWAPDLEAAVAGAQGAKKQLWSAVLSNLTGAGQAATTVYTKARAELISSCVEGTASCGLACLLPAASLSNPAAIHLSRLPRLQSTLTMPACHADCEVVLPAWHFLPCQVLPLLYNAHVWLCVLPVGAS